MLPPYVCVRQMDDIYSLSLSLSLTGLSRSYNLEPYDVITASFIVPGVHSCVCAATEDFYEDVII